MKISDLIKELQKIKKSDGDIPVFISVTYQDENLNNHTDLFEQIDLSVNCFKTEIVKGGTLIDFAQLKQNRDEAPKKYLIIE